MNNMNATQNKLLQILKQLFKFQQPEPIKKKEKKEEKEEEKSEQKPETQGDIIIPNMPAGPVGEPAVGGPAPAVGATAPAVGATAPAVGGPAPAVGATAPAVGGPAPAVGGPAPAVGGPSVGDKPEENKPIQVEDTDPNENKPEINLTKKESVGGAQNLEDLRETVTISPNLDPTLLQSLMNTTRQLIVELYVTCETDFLEGIVLFESIVAMQLAKTTNSQIKLLNELSMDYLVDHNTY
jgi:hypothetical protein